MYHAERKWAFSAAILALLARSATAILHEHLTFDPPFLDVDHFGKRTVGFAWDLSGATKALKNFVRLTPDLQVRTRWHRCNSVVVFLEQGLQGEEWRRYDGSQHRGGEQAENDLQTTVTEKQQYYMIVVSTSKH